MSIIQIEISEQDPHKMRDQLRSKALKIRDSGDPFTINSTAYHDDIFRKEFGMTMGYYVQQILKPQKPIHSKRKLF